MSKLLVVIAGPTASGKTRLALEIALHFQTEIVSADSRQFYRELTIGTAKPTEEELAMVPHHFINSHSVQQTFTAARYGQEARELINRLFTVHDVIVMAGGSGLFIDAVVSGFDDLPSADMNTREFLQTVFSTEGLQGLQRLLLEKDPGAYATIDIQNPRRLTRALEVILLTGKTYSGQLGRQRANNPWKVIMCGIDMPRAELYERIRLRTIGMIAAGLLEEARSVLPYRDNNALSTVGYKEMFDYLDGNSTWETACELIAKNTRNYAKRQMTWFRRYPGMIWLKPGESQNLIQTIESRLDLPPSR